MRPSDTIPDFTPRARRVSHVRVGQGPRLLRQKSLTHQQPRRARSRKKIPITYPLRYAPVLLGSAALFLAGLLSLPLGWGASTPARAVVTLLLSLLGLGVLFISGLRVAIPRAWKRHALRRRNLFIGLGVVMAIVTLMVISGGGRVTFGPSLSRSYWSDVISFSYVNARLVLHGHNPYTSDPAFFPALERFPYAIETPLRQGAFGQGFDYPAVSSLNAIERQFLSSASARHGEFDPKTLHSYPALSFLLYVPMIWAGIDNILLLHIAVFAGLFAWQVWLSPPGERHWGALAAGSVAALALYSLFLDNEIVCLAFVLLAWHYRRNRWVSAVLLGLGCAFKQYCWFFAPFFLLDALLSGVREQIPTADEPSIGGWRGLAMRAWVWLRAANWGEAGWRVGVLLVAFLIPNLPFIVANPGMWWASLWLPQVEPLFPMGMGVIALFTGHLFPYISPKFFTVMELFAFIGSLIAAARWRKYLGAGVLLFALIPLLFAFRSLPNYFGVAPWIALYAANMAYRAGVGVATGSRRARIAPEGQRRPRIHSSVRPHLTH